MAPMATIALNVTGDHPTTASGRSQHAEQEKEEDDGDRYADKPEQSAFKHVISPDWVLATAEPLFGSHALTLRLRGPRL